VVPAPHSKAVQCRRGRQALAKGHCCQAGPRAGAQARGGPTTLQIVRFRGDSMLSCPANWAASWANKRSFVCDRQLLGKPPSAKHSRAAVEVWSPSRGAPGSIPGSSVLTRRSRCPGGYGTRHSDNPPFLKPKPPATRPPYILGGGSCKLQCKLRGNAGVCSEGLTGERRKKLSTVFCWDNTKGCCWTKGLL